MTDRDSLLLQYDALEDGIEDAAGDRMWELADWLADNVLDEGQGGDRRSEDFKRTRVRLNDLADRRGRGVRWLQITRKVGVATASDRLPDVSVRAYRAALEAVNWDVAAANARLRDRGVRLRDQSPSMMSDMAVRQEIAKRSPERQAVLVRDLIEAEPELLGRVQEQPPRPVQVEFLPREQHVELDEVTAETIRPSLAQLLLARGMSAARSNLLVVKPADLTRLSDDDRERVLRFVDEVMTWGNQVRRELGRDPKLEVVS